MSFLAHVGGDLFAGSATDGLFRRPSEGTAVDPAGAPRPLALHGIAPNPFNPLARIRYELAVAGPVRVTVHDLMGRRVRTLARFASRPAGLHEVMWDGRGDDRRELPSGVYFARIATAAAVVTGKMILAR